VVFYQIKFLNFLVKILPRSIIFGMLKELSMGGSINILSKKEYYM